MTSDLFTPRGVNTDDRREQAQRAVAAFRRLQPTLTSYARILSRNPKARVELAAQDNGSTDGNRIFFRPPLTLGDNTPHERRLCDLRFSDGLMRCAACAVREEVLVTIYHEIAHICFDSFAAITDEDKRNTIEFAIKELGGSWGKKLHKRLGETPISAIRSYISLSKFVSPYLPLLVNGLEDARVNGELFKARAGVRKMFDADTARVFRDGFETADGIQTWHEAPLNSQITIGVFCKASGYDYSGWFHQDVVASLNDSELTSLLAGMRTIRSASAVYNMSLKVLARLRDLGYFATPDDPNEPEEQSDDSEPSDSEEGSPNPDAVPEESEQPGDSESDDGTEGESGSGESSDSDPDTGSAEEGEPDPDGSEGSGEVDGDSDSDPSGDEAGGAEVHPESDEEVSGPNDSNSSDSGSESNSDSSRDSSGETQTDSPASDNLDDASGSDDTDSDSEASGSDSSESGDSRDADGSDGHSGSDSDSVPFRGDNEPQSDDSGEPDSSGVESDPVSRDADSDGMGDGYDAGQDGSDPELDPDDSDSYDTAVPGTEDIGSSTPEFESSETARDERGEPDNSDASPGEDDTEGDLDPIDTGADDGYGGTSVNDSEEGSHLNYGSPEDVEPLLLKWEGHEEKPRTAETVENEKAIDTAIIQGLYFTNPSKNIIGVREHFDGKPIIYDGQNWSRGWKVSSLARSSRRIGKDADMVIPETVLQPALQRTRRTFSDNARGARERNKRSGKINAKALGKRAALGDDRLFAKRHLPGRKDYFVVIGMDISYSTIGVNLALEKRAIMAQAEMLNRVGVPFSIYAHTGGEHSEDSAGMDLDIYHIKDPREPWDEERQSRLARIGPVMANLDGHALEFLRKRVEESTATDKIILYYSDGKMPAENHDEELSILTREIRYCRAKQITLLGVGIRTDSPARHGLETAEVHEDSDLVKVVELLGKRLAKKG